jgi:hypothetical protein
MMTVAQRRPDLARLRPLFVLEQMPRQVRSDVLKDGSIITACGFTAKPQVQAIDEVVVFGDELFAAFRNAPKVPHACLLHGPNDALIDATISINDDGSASVEIAGKKKRFLWITLLSADADTRLAHLDQFLHRYPLYAGDAASLRALVARTDFTDDDFLAAATLFESSPETFIEHLPRKSGTPKAKTASRLSMFSLRMTAIGIICYRR